MNISEIILNGSKILERKKIQSHRLDSELIMSNLLGQSREKILINDNQNIPYLTTKKFYKLINRRSKNEPLAYILNYKDFWLHKFYVTKHSLIPRPETELMIEMLSKYFKSKSPEILDIGLGSGCILLSLLMELKKARGVGLDISKNAIRVAKKNSRNLMLDNRIKFLNRSISDYLAGKFDLIVSNPPYINTRQMAYLPPDVKNFEPHVALNGGYDGLDVIRKVIYKSKSILKINGILAIEIGNGQYKKVSQILKEHKFRIKFLIKDYKENIRSVISEMQQY
mgnify:CR=1 FL=1|tara:strand:+ start:212 stop:1057 length:846 start_codon:yes stop_codon:yes gene_type:complete